MEKPPMSIPQIANLSEEGSQWFSHLFQKKIVNKAFLGAPILFVQGLFKEKHRESMGRSPLLLFPKGRP